MRGIFEKIQKTGSGYQVKSEHGKSLSSPNLSKGAAKKRLAQIEYFKHKKETGAATPKGPMVNPRYDKSHDEGFQDKRYADIKTSRESRREDSEEHNPINLRNFYQPPKRTNGWSGLSYSPPIAKLQRLTGNEVIIKETGGTIGLL